MVKREELKRGKRLFRAVPNLRQPKKRHRRGKPGGLDYLP
jgi:hypothetical protein